MKQEIIRLLERAKEDGRTIGDVLAEVRGIAEPVSAQAPTIYVEARECSNCGHAGINDSSTTMSACNQCGWTGPYQREDHCPGCSKDGTMTCACPECGERYSIVAEAHIEGRAPAAAGDALDATRYRWLCDKFGITKLPCAIERIIEGTYVADGKEGIDAAIDAAIAAQRKDA